MYTWSSTRTATSFHLSLSRFPCKQSLSDLEEFSLMIEHNVACAHIDVLWVTLEIEHNVVSAQIDKWVTLEALFDDVKVRGEGVACCTITF